MSRRRTQQAHEIAAGILTPGDCAVDATIGNGHDTLFLARCVGPDGQVFGFDVQPEAVAATQRRLEQARTAPASDSLAPCVLIQASHANMLDHLPATRHGRVRIVMFNLGYLPGFDHATTTTVESTLAGIAAAEQLLEVGGILSVLAYPGHAAGRAELDHLLNYIASRDSQLVWHEHDQRAAPESAPRLFVGVRQ